MTRLLTFVMVICMLLLSSGCACQQSVGPTAPTANAAAVVKRMAEQYAALRVYSDEGTVRYAGVDGFAQQRWFRTRFDRQSGLTFEIADDANVSRGDRLDASSADSAVITDSDGKKTQAAPVAAATGELQGVGLYTSIFVPRLLFGVDFCGCSSAGRWALDGEETIEGRRATRVRFHSDPSRALVLVIDAETHLLRQAKIEMFNETRPQGEITIRYAISKPVVALVTLTEARPRPASKSWCWSHRAFTLCRPSDRDLSRPRRYVQVPALREAH